MLLLVKCVPFTSRALMASRVCRGLSTSMSKYEKHVKLSSLVKASSESSALESTSSSELNDSVSKELITLGQKLGLAKTDVDRYRVDMPPVCKEMFLGKLDTRLFSYPDVLENDRFMALEERVQKLYNFIRSHKATFDANLDLDTLKDSMWHKLIREPYNLQGLEGPYELGGQNLCVTEKTRVLEELGENLSLATTVSHPSLMAIAALEMLDNEALRNSYLKDLYSGNKIAAVCWADDESGCDILSTRTKAEIEKNEDKGDGNQASYTFNLNGIKTWVSNGSKADLYIVFAMARIRNEFSSQVPQTTAFVVERKWKGVNVNPRNKSTQKATLHHLDLAEVSFENVIVPSSHVIGAPGGGSSVYQHILSQEKCLSSAQISLSLKKLLNLTIKHVSQRQAYNNKLSYYPLVKFKLGECAMYLYALQSSIYMTTGLADVQKEVDVEVESAVTKLFALHCSKLITDHCTSLLGRVGLDPENELLNSILRDLKAFAHWPISESILTLFASNACLEYAGLEMAEELQLNRSPSSHPVYFLLKQWQQHKAINRKDPSLLLGLDDHVHPCLIENVKMLERELMLFPFVIEVFFGREGKNVQAKELELSRLTDAVMFCYANLCALSHANRSMCRGHPMMLHQIDMADSFVRQTSPIIRMCLELVGEGYKSQRPDGFIADIGTKVIEEGGYCASHPLTRNIW